jgi:hypothetical protein
LPTCVPVKLNVIKASPAQVLCANSVKYLILSLVQVIFTGVKLLPFAMEVNYFCNKILRTNIVTNVYITIKLQKKG